LTPRAATRSSPACPITSARKTAGGNAPRPSAAKAGFLTLQRHFDHAAKITWMAVHAHHRHHGIGRALVTRLCADLAAEGRRLLLVPTVSPPTRAGNHPTATRQPAPSTRPWASSSLARDLPGLWPGDSAVLLVKPLAHAH
jgi:Acetyltransferase (GNAT) family